MSRRVLCDRCSKVFTPSRDGWAVIAGTTCTPDHPSPRTGSAVNERRLFICLGCKADFDRWTTLPATRFDEFQADDAPADVQPTGVYPAVPSVN